MTDIAHTFNNLALRVCLASFDDFIGCRVQLKTVGFVAIAGDLTHLDILQRNYTFRFFVLESHEMTTTTDKCYILTTSRDNTLLSVL